MKFLVEDNTSRILLGEDDVYDEVTGSYTIPEFSHLKLIGSRESMNQLRSGLNNMTLPQRVEMKRWGKAGEQAGLRLKEMFGTK